MISIKRSFFLCLFMIASSLLAQSASEAVSIETPKSAAEIIKEIEEEALKYQETEKIPEESVPGVSADKDLEEIITESPFDPEDATGTENLDSDDKEFNSVNQTHSVSSFEKPASLEPLLILNGKPVDEINELNSVTRISGRLYPEKKLLGRRKFVYRWVLKTGDSQLIPLKSNLKLLQEVKKENNLDGFVTLTGRFVDSGFKSELKYFVIESLTAVDELPIPASQSESKGEGIETDSEKKEENPETGDGIEPIDKKVVSESDVPVDAD